MLTKENPWNSSWLIERTTSAGIGVKTGSSFVNSASKFSASFLFFYFIKRGEKKNEEECQIRTHFESGMEIFKMSTGQYSREKWWLFMTCRYPDRLHRSVKMKILTIFGLNGGLIFLASNASQSISRKNECDWMAFSIPWDGTEPSRLLGFFVMNWKRKQQF